MAVPTKSILGDGVADYIDYGVPKWLTTAGVGTVGMGGWFKPVASSTNYQRLLGFLGTSGGTPDSMQIDIVESDDGTNPSKLRGSTNGADGFTATFSDAAVDFGTWIHIYLQRMATTGQMQLYANAVIATTLGSGNVQNFNDSTGVLSALAGVSSGTPILHANANCLHLVGYKGEMTADQITSLYNCGLSKDPRNVSGLPTFDFYSPCDENTVYDHAYEVMGGNAAILDGVNQFVNCGDVCDTGSNQFAYSMWFKVPATATTDILMAKRDYSTETNGYQLALVGSDGHIQGYFDDGTNNVLVDCSTTGLDDDQLHHVVIQRGASGSMAVYTDNSSDGSGSNGSLGSLNTSADLTFGARSNPIDYVTGRIGFIEKFDSALSTDDIALLYNGGKPIQSADTVGFAGTKTNFWELGRGDTHPTATDSVGSNNGTYQNMTQANLGTFYGGTMISMSAGSIEADVPSGAELPICSAPGGLSNVTNNPFFNGLSIAGGGL